MLRTRCVRYGRRSLQRGFIGAMLSGAAAPIAGLLGAGVTAAASVADTNSTNSANQAMLTQQEQYNTQAVQQAQGFDQSQVAQQEQFQVQQTQQAEAYNTMMANTAMQRKAADLQAAGLNPMLAGINQQGAPAPTINAPSGAAMSSPVLGAPSSPSRVSNFSGAISNALGSATAIKNYDILTDQQTAIKAQAERDHAAASSTAVDAAIKSQDLKGATVKADAAQQMQDLAIKQANQALDTSAAQAASYRANTAGQVSQNVGLKNEADYQGSLGPVGKWIDHSLGLLGSAGNAFHKFMP